MWTAGAPPAVSASDFLADSNFEFGRKGASGLVDEEDLTDEFDYSRYRVKLSDRPDQRFAYNILYEFYHKKYDTLENLDNFFNTAGVGFDWVAYSQKPFSVTIAPDFKFKDKSYPENKRQSYEQIKFDLPVTLKAEDDWSIKLTNGINNYNYLSTRDEFKYHAKVEARKELFKNTLVLESFYKYQYVARQKLTDRTEHSGGGSVEVKLKTPVVKSLEAGVEAGKENTKFEEEREDSYDYKYLKWYAKTKYELSDRVDCFAKYTDSSRDYSGFNHDFGGFMIEDNVSVKVFDVKETSFKLKLNYLHKQFRFPWVSSFDFHYNGVANAFELERKNDWTLAGGFESRFYDYPAKRTNDKIYYIGKASVDKYLWKKTLLAGFEYKYTFKNFLHKPDIVENVFAFRAKCRF